jgi:predicted transcriptional regulator
VLALTNDLSIGEAMRQLRRHHQSAHHHIYVVDRAQRLVGVLHIRDLVSRGSKETLADIMRPAHTSLVATSRLASAAAHLAWRKLDTLPVTDDTGVLLGMVRYRQLRRIDSVAGSGALAGTLLGLGELYWLGLAMFLPGVPGDADHRLPTPEPTEGIHHHAR